MKRLFSALLAALLLSLNLTSFHSAAVSNYGTDVSELIDLYKNFYNYSSIVGLYFEESNADYSSYCVIRDVRDEGRIAFYADPDEEIDIELLMQVSGYSEDELKLRAGYSSFSFGEWWNISMTFYSKDHDANYEAALKITEVIADKYEIDASQAYVDLDKKLVVRNNRTCWNRMRRIDEFGIESPLIEELTVKQIADLNSDIAKNGFSAWIDEDTGNALFGENTTEKEKLEFAVWLKENYGFYPFTYSAALFEEFIPPQHKALYFTDIPGDVNNDGKLNINDLVTLHFFLLGDEIYTYELTNWQNGDLCKDGRIDVFDLVLLRSLYLSSNQ